MESCSIVAVSTIQTYKKYERRWWAGWAACGATVLLSLYLGLLAQARGEAINSLGEARQKMAELQSQQTFLIENFVKAWQNQQATAEALIGYGEYHKERQGLVDYNVQAAVKDKVKVSREDN